MSEAFDPAVCPLCGEPNACGVAAGKGNCWCFALRVDEAVLTRVPEAARGVACVCERCASGKRSAHEVQVRIDQLRKGRL